MKWYLFVQKDGKVEREEFTDLAKADQAAYHAQFIYDKVSKVTTDPDPNNVEWNVS